MTALISSQRVNDIADVAGVLTTYTHICGYTHAWQDPLDQTLIWLYPTCPADAVIAEVKQIITGFVTSGVQTASLATGPDVDMRDRILRLINQVQDAVAQWLHDKNTTEYIADFIINDNRLRGYVVAELIAQGIVAQ